MLLLLVGGIVHGAAAALPEPVARVAGAVGVPANGVSLWVQEIGQPAPLVAHLPDTPRNPASTMKLLTTFAALEGLTPAYAWETEAYALGPVRDGVLHGDLLLRGHGDPYLVLEEFWKLTRGIRQTGIRRIDGDVVLDASYFDLPPESPGEFDDRPDRLYNLVPHALLVNFNAMRFEFSPAGQRVRVSTEPELDNLRIHNRLRVRRGACRGYQRGIALDVSAPPARDEVALDGSYPSGCHYYAMTRSVLRPESYAYGLFERFWRQLGGELRGGWRSGVLPAALEDDRGARIHVHRSRPLGDLVRLVNKYSNNVMARHLALTLGAELYGPPATPEKGRTATLELLARRGVDTRGLVIDNPAGLSRDARLTARQLGQVLQAAWDSPYMPEFVASLSLSGLDGTMRRRFRDGAAAGRMHLKTGTIDDVSGIAGYVQAVDDRRYAVVVLVNAPDAQRGSGHRIQDALLEWVFQGGCDTLRAC